MLPTAAATSARLPAPSPTPRLLPTATSTRPGLLPATPTPTGDPVLHAVPSSIRPGLLTVDHPILCTPCAIPNRPTAIPNLCPPPCVWRSAAVCPSDVCPNIRASPGPFRATALLLVG
jgi:hypothetical protein